MKVNDKMKVYSGKCALCEVGHPVGVNDDGRELHTGDIVLIWHGEYLGEDCETWTPAGGLTVVVSDQFRAYSDGTLAEKEADIVEPFVMGIKDCGFNDPAWRIQSLKKFSDVIDGEHWPAYGFSYSAKAVFVDANKEPNA